MHMDGTVVAFWFRRDLRLTDNRGLYHALQSGRPVLPVFIFDRVILDDLQDIDDVRITFIHREIVKMNRQLVGKGSGMLVLHDQPVRAWQTILEAYPQIEAVYTNHDYEPYAKNRDRAISDLLSEHGVAFKTYKDQVIFERDEMLTNSGAPYTVFTPYSKKWLERLSPDDYHPFPNGLDYSNWIALAEPEVPSLKRMGFKESDKPIPGNNLSDETLLNYSQLRDLPAANGTSRMSHHLRFGTVSIRQLVHRSIHLEATTYLRELIWREFYMQILDHYPRVVDTSFKEKYDRILWRNDQEAFDRWCNGETGVPMVDAGMRQLNQTGYMHNRLRMIVAGFLTKNLLIDWRWGEAYFARKLLDYELASNNGGWQWAAGCGTDAAPYFRVFNPATQQQKFDPKKEYIKQWIPEVDTAEYPAPLVDLKESRKRALQVYRSAL